MKRPCPLVLQPTPVRKGRLPLSRINLPEYVPPSQKAPRLHKEAAMTLSNRGHIKLTSKIAPALPRLWMRACANMSWTGLGNCNAP